MGRTENLLRKGKLAELGEQLEDSKKRVERLLDEIRIKSFPLDGVETVDVEALQQATDDLAEEQERLLDLKKQIAEFEV